MVRNPAGAALLTLLALPACERIANLSDVVDARGGGGGGGVAAGAGLGGSQQSPSATGNGGLLGVSAGRGAGGKSGVGAQGGETPASCSLDSSEIDECVLE